MLADGKRCGHYGSLSATLEVRTSNFPRGRFLRRGLLLEGLGGFNSEPNKKLRLTPSLASRGAGKGRVFTFHEK